MRRSKHMQGERSCEVCGNAHDACFEILLGGEKHVFDSFECAMRAFQLRCQHCGTQIIGHGVQVGEAMYCSHQCAHEAHGRDDDRRLQLREHSSY